jgi:glycerol-3-phosphate dehydrogenase
MAKDVVDRAVIELRRLTQDSVTEKLPLVGADGYFALEQQKERIAQESGLDVTTVTHLLNRHGSLISEILDLVKVQPQLASKLDTDLPYIKAEIVYAASHEGARSVDDVISRRTRLSFEAVNHGAHLADEIATLVSPVLGWSAKERKESVAQYTELVEREKAALGELLEVNS